MLVMTKLCLRTSDSNTWTSGRAGNHQAAGSSNQINHLLADQDQDQVLAGDDDGDDDIDGTDDGDDISDDPPLPAAVASSNQINHLLADWLFFDDDDDDDDDKNVLFLGYCKFATKKTL